MARRPAIHKQIQCRKAPKPVGAYSQAVLVEQPGATLFVSGQIPIEVPSGNVFTGDIKRQADITFNHLKNIVLDAGFQMDEIVKVTIFLTNLKNFEVVNSVYQKFFVGGALPSRAAVEVAGLPKGVGIEVECIAMKKGQSPDELFGDGSFR